MAEENNWCAAKELCICKAAAATTRHLCPVCQGRVHAICGEICEDASILYHTTCYTCFARYKKTFENPESFRRFIAAAEKDNLQDDDEEEHLGGAASTSIDEEVDVVAPVSNMDSAAIMRADKVKKRREFIKKLTLAQCEIENSAAANGVHYVKLVSVGGIPLTKLLLSDLQLFCATHKISGYRQKKKEDVSQLIAARVASDNIYASIGRLGMTHPIGRNNEQESNAAAGGKPQNYRSKMVRPKAVTKTGSYFRIINLWFSAQNRHLVLLTGKKMNRAELDVGGYRHKQIWDNLAEQYNKNTGIADCIHGDNAYLDVIQTPHMLYDLENPEDFDNLEGRDVAQFVRYITHQYYVTYKSVSGDHARFEDRVGEKSYLLYFHNMITATGAENLESLMKAELSAEVFAESSVPGCLADNETAVTPTAKKHRMNRKTGPPSSTKEQTDNAILRYISRTEQQDSTGGGSISSSRSGFGTAASTAKDDYIREKKRMAVEVFDIAMSKEITDAVDTSLKKWKASLLELRELKEDGITGTDHPFFIATEAAADLHESTFHSCLARANARAAQQEERGANTRNEESKAEDADDNEDIEEVPEHDDDDVSVSEDDLTDVRVETICLPPAWYKR